MKDRVQNYHPIWEKAMKYQYWYKYQNLKDIDPMKRSISMSKHIFMFSDFTYIKLYISKILILEYIIGDL